MAHGEFSVSSRESDDSSRDTCVCLSESVSFPFHIPTIHPAHALTSLFASAFLVPIGGKQQMEIENESAWSVCASGIERLRSCNKNQMIFINKIPSLHFYCLIHIDSFALLSVRDCNLLSTGFEILMWRFEVSPSFNVIRMIFRTDISFRFYVA